MQNLHWKIGQQSHLLELSWPIERLQLRSYFFRNKTFLFFKIESWNFQHLFAYVFSETSQNFNSFCLYRQILFSFFFHQLSDWVEILWGFTESFFKQMLKISTFYLEKQKFIPTKMWFKPRVNELQYQNKLALFTDPIFSDGFNLMNQNSFFVLSVILVTFV